MLHNNCKDQGVLYHLWVERLLEWNPSLSAISTIAHFLTKWKISGKNNLIQLTFPGYEPQQKYRILDVVWALFQNTASFTKLERTLFCVSMRCNLLFYQVYGEITEITNYLYQTSSRSSWKTKWHKNFTRNSASVTIEVIIERNRYNKIVSKAKENFREHMRDKILSCFNGSHAFWTFVKQVNNIVNDNYFSHSQLIIR